MFASVCNRRLEWMALTPHIRVLRHVSLPSILGNMLTTFTLRRPGLPSSADTPVRMAGGFPEYMAITPSTLR